MRRADPDIGDSGKKLVILLEQASLESVKGAGGKEYQLLNPDKHKDRILKSNRDVSTVRPDIIHQCLLMLLDSPLNRMGMLQVYIRTQKNIIIEVNPKIRIPRTFDRFCGLMVQLLHKLSIHAAEGNHEKLLRVVKNPITRYFPAGCAKIGMSFSADKIVHPSEVPSMSRLGTSESIVVVIGAMAHGSVVSTAGDFLDEVVSISRFPLSAAQVCSRVCTAFEEAWDVEKFEPPSLSSA
ncbi:Ribosomal RNA small subunit methyltransferase NEP1 [Echinococcus granulosus]|uniref:Putative ribosome biogenesis protein NEP1 n=1 Tax=Echinococcus granulosus TaxID=6210 RepID=U6JFW7_ECHGR|nr:putative ribosome biogenesis protein NEP1 [Echinococcus granulosus]EUB55178.1 putative ribosome biogenesis protein NEP1 [Echinococcus granulosus]KAH9278549.1 Ribosomal RNA small subunit methyltransferase NEP1 [Echinococcus granulosus]CDS21346.1 ribosomal RNA small subunit methyltransferase [Echinococcus granulosus]